MKKVISSILIYFGLQIIVSIVVAMITGVVIAVSGGDVENISQNATVLGLATLITNILAVIVLLKMRYADFSLGRLKSVGIAHAMFLSVAFAFSQVAPLTWLTEILALPDILKAEFTESMNNVWGIIAICLAAPIAEELLFRGAIQGALQKTMKPKWAIFVSAMIFGVIHFNPVQMFGAFIMGLVLGWLYYRTGSVWPGIVTHAINNITSTVLAQYFPVDASLTEMTGGGTLMYVLLAASVSLFVVTIVCGRTLLPSGEDFNNL